MQNLFARDTDWHTPWLERVLPNVVRLSEAWADHTIFTRFIPARHPGEGHGTWKSYYERWSSMTVERLPSGMIELVPELARLVPPAEVVDKRVYSPWYEPSLAVSLKRRSADTLVISGGETDVCVLATVLGAVDGGYRVVIAKDGLCSSCDEAHNASITLYLGRYGQQIEVASIAEILEALPVARSV